MLFSESQSDDSKSRPFICPCSKSYLSYPALFTHIKHKHNGIAPGEIVRPRSVNKRGRPRKFQTDLPADLICPLPDYKNPGNRPILKNLQSPHSYSAQSPQPAKKQKLNSNFIPPIPTSHLSIIKSYQTPQKFFKQSQNIQVKSISLSVYLLQRLKNVFSQLNTRSYMPTSKLQALIKSNQCYQQAKLIQPINTRRIVGNQTCQIELSSAIFIFLQVCEEQLSKKQYKNLQFLMSLFFTFNLEMVEHQKNISTHNYIRYINNFCKKLQQEVIQDSYCNNIFCLEKHTTLRLLEVFHIWLIEQKLSHHELQINPNFRVEVSNSSLQNLAPANSPQ